MLAELLKATALGLGGYNKGQEEVASRRAARTKAQQDEEDRRARLALIQAQTRKANEPDAPSTRAVPEHEAYAAYYDAQIAAGKTPAQADAAARQRYGKAAPREDRAPADPDAAEARRIAGDRRRFIASQINGLTADGKPIDAAAVRRINAMADAIGPGEPLKYTEPERIPYAPGVTPPADYEGPAPSKPRAFPGSKPATNDPHGTLAPGVGRHRSSGAVVSAPPGSSGNRASSAAQPRTPEAVSSSNRPPARQSSAPLGPRGQPVTNSTPTRQEPTNEDTLSDADLWERKKEEGMSAAQATAYVQSRAARRR